MQAVVGADVAVEVGDEARAVAPREGGRLRSQPARPEPPSPEIRTPPSSATPHGLPVCRDTWTTSSSMSDGDRYLLATCPPL